MLGNFVTGVCLLLSPHLVLLQSSSQSGIMLLVCQTALSFPDDGKRVNSISPFAYYKYFLPVSHELGAQMNPIHLLHPGASSAFYYNSRNNFQVSFCLPQSSGKNKHMLPYLRSVISCWVATGEIVTRRVSLRATLGSSPSGTCSDLAFILSKYLFVFWG